MPSPDSAPVVRSVVDPRIEERPRLPDVRVLRTRWHPRPEKRSARLRLGADAETLDLREGDALGGLVIKEITPSAVLFTTGDVEIRRRVGQGSSGG